MASPASCAYCGLPVASAEPVGETVPVYCCFGCQFAAGVTGEPLSSSRLSLRGPYARLGLSIFFTMNVIMLTMALWAYADKPDTRFAATLAEFLRYLSMLFALPVLILLGGPLLNSAIGQLRRGTLSTDLLLLTGVLAAYAASVISTVRGSGHVYFEVGCVILVLVSIGRWLEAAGRVKASRALDELEQLLPARVMRLRDGETEEIAVDEVRMGDLLRVRPGERIPVDAEIRGGAASVDEQFFTGESAPHIKAIGDSVLGGCLNLDGDLVIQATSTSRGGALSRLVRHVREARFRRGIHQTLADRWSEFFFPVIGSAALLTFGVHWWLDHWSAGLLNALAVILIACPCALALATPLAVWAALGTAARRGVLFRSGEAIERLAGARRVFFDKTGTLTTGQPRVGMFVCESPDRYDGIRSLVSAMTVSSPHPFSRAIHEFLETATPFPELRQLRSVAGAGLEALLPRGGAAYVGSLVWMTQHSLPLGPRIRAALRDGKVACASQVFVGQQAGPASSSAIEALFVLDEELRPSARPCLVGLDRLGIVAEVLTGDRAERGLALGLELGIQVRSQLLPEQKLEQIRRAAEAETGLERTARGVVMVGDGLNDAPALAAASLGIALGCGTDVSRDAADVCLIHDDLAMIPWSIEFARRTVRTIRQNLAWSFGYNGLGVIVAACGWLHPAIAAALMVVSSLMVLGNSLRLQEGIAVPADGTPPSDRGNGSPLAFLEAEA